MWKSLITILCATGTVSAFYHPQSVHIHRPSRTNVKIGARPSSDVNDSVCPKEFVLLGNNDCYYISLGVASWQEAHFFCIDKKASLAELFERDMNERLKDYLRDQQSNQFERWIGAKYNWKEKTWEWGITGKNYTYDGFSKLRSGTDRVDEQWHCAVMNPRQGNNWAARSCVENRHYICHTRANSTGTVLAINEPQSVRVHPYSENSVNTEGRPSARAKTSTCPSGFVLLGNKNCFYISPGVANWLGAQFFCKDRNATLAELPKKHMNRKLKKYLRDQRTSRYERWIGARFNWKERTWEWGITGKNYTYDGFSKLRSGTDRVDEQWHCAVMNPERKYNWAARSCVEDKHYICHTRAVLTDKGGKNSPNGKRRQRIKNRYNKKGNLAQPLNDRNEILPFSQRQYRTIKRSGPKWSDEPKPEKHSLSNPTRWAPGTKPSDRLEPVKSKDPTVPEQWVSPQKAEIMTSKDNFVKASKEESLLKGTSPSEIPPTFSGTIDTETGNMLTQFGGHMFL